MKACHWRIRERGLNKAVFARLGGGRGLLICAPVCTHAGSPLASSPACGLRRQVCPLWCFCDISGCGERREGASVVFPCVLARSTCAPTFLCPSHSTARRCALHASGIEMNNMVCRGGDGATALAGEGMVKQLCARASTCNFPVMCRVLAPPRHQCKTCACLSFGMAAGLSFLCDQDSCDGPPEDPLTSGHTCLT